MSSAKVFIIVAVVVAVAVVTAPSTRRTSTAGACPQATLDERRLALLVVVPTVMYSKSQGGPVWLLRRGLL